MAEKIVSCFIDEAGDFGNYDYHSPYYIVSVVIHNQSKSIQQDIDRLEVYLSSLGFGNHALHTAPLIRRETDYENLQVADLVCTLEHIKQKIDLGIFCVFTFLCLSSAKKGI